MCEPLPHGQMIGLKQGAEEPYTILHKNTFPGVLERIALSNIGNYSIFMHNGLLFGFYLYCGKNYQVDMEELSADTITREWWKLTAPLQQPFDGRGQGEWWSELKPVFQYGKDNITLKSINRHVFIIPCGDIRLDDKLLEVQLKNDERIHQGLNMIYLFQGHGNLFCYTELNEEFTGSGLPEFLESIPGCNGKISEMKEVFYTAGKSEADNRIKVFVTGCFDMLHSGHVEFLREASSYGELHVCIGSDANVSNLKGRPPVNTQEERKYMLSALRHVHQCKVNKGWGILDFIDEIEEIMPDIFIVNEDGNTPAKAQLCENLGIEYIVLKRLPHEGLPVRSTTSLRSDCRIPYRIDLAGGWLDQPFVSRYHPGPVLTISLEPLIEFNDRSGMATSTRRKAIELWQTNIPAGDPEHLARILFSFDNPPGTKDVSGSQDALGIALPGLNKLFYRGGYWPESITSEHREEILSWIEDHLRLVTLGPRQANYQVVEHTFVGTEGAKKLSLAAENCWDAILAMDIMAFGKAFRESFDAQVSMFPNMADDNIRKSIELYRDRAYGWKLSGAGGGGYLILVTDEPVEGAMRIRIRRREGI